MEKSFNVMLIALEQKENYLSIRYFETMDSAHRFKEELKDYNENFVVLGIFEIAKNSKHIWEVSIYDKELDKQHQVLVTSKKECEIVARIFLEYKDEYNITFEKIY